MMISAEYPQEFVDKIVWTLDAAIDYEVGKEEDVEVLRDFITSLNNLKRSDGVVILRPGEYARLCKADDELAMLHGFGVDNWCGYDDAMEELNKEI